jgi:hypothetical protein
MQALLEQLRQADTHGFFAQPVDAVALGLPTYHTIVTQPMDLQTCGRKIRTKGYASIAALVTDLRLMLANARLFNGNLLHPVHIESLRLEAVLNVALMKSTEKAVAAATQGRLGPVQLLACRNILARLLEQDEWIEPFLEPTPTDDPKPVQPTCVRRILERLGRTDSKGYADCAAFGDELELMWQAYVKSHGALHPVSRQAVRLCYLTREVFFDELHQHTTAHQRELDQQQSKRRIKRQVSSEGEPVKPLPKSPHAMTTLIALPKLAHLPAPPRSVAATTAAAAAAAVSVRKRVAPTTLATVEQQPPKKQARSKPPPPIVAPAPVPVVLAPLHLVSPMVLSAEQRAHLMERARKTKARAAAPVLPSLAHVPLPVAVRTVEPAHVRVTPAQKMSKWAEQYAAMAVRFPVPAHLLAAVDGDDSDDEPASPREECVLRIPRRMQHCLSPSVVLGSHRVMPLDSHYIVTSTLAPGLARTLVLLGETSAEEGTEVKLERIAQDSDEACLALQLLSRHFHLGDMHQAAAHDDFCLMQLPEVPASARTHVAVMHTPHHTLLSLRWLPHVAAYHTSTSVRIADDTGQVPSYHMCRALFLYHAPNALIVLPRGTQASF